MSEQRPIPLCEPFLGGREREYLTACVDTNFVSSVGPFVERFEREFAAYVGAKYAVACATGTAAIHVALRLAGVAPGDEVVVPTLTFIASANPILYEHATPVMVDSERSSWNVDPALVVEELDRRAKAGARMPKVVEIVHILGHPADISPVVEACDRYGIFLLEDAAEALGARYTAGTFAGRHVGTIGRVGCFSFNGNKIMTTGGGGMITTDDPELARRAKHLTTQARLPGIEYRHDEVGYNYRLTNVAAAIGVAQLEQLPTFIERKHAIARRYDEALKGLPGVSIAPRTSWAAPTFWLYTIELDPQRARLDWRGLQRALEDAGIHTRPIWSPLHQAPMYRDARRLGGAVAEEIFSRSLSLPCSIGLTDSDQARVADTLRRLLG